jgi:hypothetical protein
MHIMTLRNFSTINCSDRVNVSRARLRAGSKKHLFDTLLATTLQQTSSMLLPIQDDAEQDSLRKKMANTNRLQQKYGKLRFLYCPLLSSS